MNNIHNIISAKVRGPVALLLLMLAAGTLKSAAATETATRIYDMTGIELVSTVEADGNEYIHVSLPGLEQTATPGAPQLPVEYIRFLVPVYCKVTGVRAEAHQTFPRSAGARIYPAQEPVSVNNDGPVKFTAPTDSAYSREYPIRAEYIEDGFIDGCNHLVTVAVYPVGYSPEQEMLTVASSVAVTLEYESCSASELTSTPLFPPVRSRYLDLESMVVNPSKASSPNYAPRKKATAQLPEYYYIITPRNLEKAFGDLAVWKRQKGYNVIVKCIEDICADPRYKIGSTYSVIGTDSAEHVLDSAMSLRCYLKDQYVLNGHFFCLLAGDWRTPMPIRKATYNDSTVIKKTIDSVLVPVDTVYVTDNCEDAVPTDSYFANLTKNYQLVRRSHMSIYSVTTNSVEFKHDVSVGRLLCATPREVENYTHKLILYEGNPGYGDNGYLSDAIFFEACQKGWNKDKYEWYHTECLLGELKNIVDKCDFLDKKIVYQDQFHIAMGADPTKIDPSAVTPENADGPSGIEIMKKISQTGFSVWHGHGSPYGVLCGASGYLILSDDILVGQRPYQWIGMYKSVPNSGLNNLRNKDKPSIVFSISCENAPFDVLTWDEGTNTEFKFDKVNLGRAFTTEGINGGPAAIMTSRSVYLSGSSHIESVFLDSIKHSYKIGVTLRKAISQCNRGNTDALKMHLIGEPEFEMWLGKPNKFEINFNPGISGINIDGALPDSTFYAMTDGNSFIQKTLAEGTAYTNPYSGEYCFSLWRSGYLPEITLYGQKGSLTKAKRYVVRNVVLGNPADNSQTNYSVGNGGELSVHAIDKVSIYNGFSILDGGSAEFECDQSVELNGGIVRKGGRLVIRAKDVRMASGFKVEEGGILKIENN